MPNAKRKYSKNGKNFNRKRHSRKGQGKLSAKRTKKIVSDMLKKKLDERIEDKYKITDWIDIVNNYQSGEKDLLVELSPAISKGTGSSERISDKIFLKHISLMLRYRPKDQVVQIPVLPASTTGGNYPLGTGECPLDSNLPDVEVFLVKINRALNDAAEVYQALRVKFRQAGLWKQEMDQNVGQNAVRSVKLCEKVKMKRRSRFATWIRSSNDPPDDETGYMTACITAESYKNVHHGVYKKVLLEDGPGNPQNFTYFLYFQFGNKFPTSYITDLGPRMLNYRIRWVYEDA